MDFNGINNRIILQQTPNHPKCPQHQRMSGSNVNFCGLINLPKTGKNSAKSQLNAFVDKHAATLYYHKLNFEYGFHEKDKENLKKLIPYGCKAMDNYRIHVGSFRILQEMKDHDITSREFNNKRILAGDVIDCLPENIDFMRHDVLDLLAYNNPKDTPVSRFDEKREIFQNVLKSKEASAEDKLWWLKHSVAKNVFNIDDIDTYKEKTIENFTAFARTNDETERLGLFLKDFNLSEETIQRAKTLVLSEKITKENVVDIIDFSTDEDFCDNNLDKNLDEILNAIDKNPKLGKHLDNMLLLSKEERDCNNDGAQLSPKIIKDELNKEDPELNFNNQLLDFIIKNRENGRLFRNNEDYLNFISKVDKNNFQLVKDLREKDGLHLQNVINIVRNCKDENGKFRLHPGQREPLVKFLNDKKVSYVFKSAIPIISEKFIKENEDGSSYFDKEGFNRTVESFAYNVRFFDLVKLLGDENFANLILGEDFGINQANLKTVFRISDTVLRIKEDLANKNQTFNFLDKALSDIDFRLNENNVFLPVENKYIQDYSQNILVSKSNSLSSFERTMANSITLLKSFDRGLPLKYSREEFLSDLNKLCNNKERVEILSSKTGVKIITDAGGRIKGYDGIILFDNLDENDPFEGEIYKLAHKFLYENEIKTSNRDLDKNLNIIIKAFPEFINIIGKKQHKTHNYTLDIHTLLVLANSINHPDYKNLLPVNKTILKNAALFHDISKAQEQIDDGHQSLSAIYAKGIAGKLIKNFETRERLSEFIKNHHWLKEYQTAWDKSKAAEEIAFKFRRPGDFDAAKIMAQADLMSISEAFYETFKDALKEENLAEIEKNIEKFNSKGCALFSDYFIAPKKTENFVQIYNGKEYRVIDFHKISNDEDLGDYGFVPGRSKDDVNFLVHMVNDTESGKGLETVKRLASYINEGCLSVSLIDPNHARTYQNRRYGVVLSTINDNIINIDYQNQGSGYKKGIDEATEFIFYNTAARNNFRKYITKSLGIKNISDEEYAKFYKENLSPKTTLVQIPKDKEYTLCGKKFSGEDLRNAIKEFQNSLIDKNGENHNEIVCYAPKIRAVIAKERSLSKVPDDVLEFANKNNLPIILI